MELSTFLFVSFFSYSFIFLLCLLFSVCCPVGQMSSSLETAADSSSSSFSSPSSSSCSGVAVSALTTQLLQDGKKVEPETKLQNQDSRIDRSLPEVPSSSTDKFTHGIHCADFLKLIELYVSCLFQRRSLSVLSGNVPVRRTQTASARKHGRRLSGELHSVPFRYKQQMQVSMRTANKSRQQAVL